MYVYYSGLAGLSSDPAIILVRRVLSSPQRRRFLFRREQHASPYDVWHQRVVGVAGRKLPPYPPILLPSQGHVRVTDAVAGRRRVTTFLTAMPSWKTENTAAVTTRLL